MTYNGIPKGHIRRSEAARRLRVSQTTVSAWVRSGRLKGIHRLQTGDGPITVVEESSLARAFDVQCVHCGRVFKARRPERSKYCSRKHENDHLRGIPWRG